MKKINTLTKVIALLGFIFISPFSQAQNVVETHKIFEAEKPMLFGGGLLLAGGSNSFQFGVNPELLKSYNSYLDAGFITNIYYSSYNISFSSNEKIKNFQLGAGAFVRVWPLEQFFIQLQEQFRVLHWETKSYARHKAYGEIYDTLDDLVDKFMETYMGKYGRPKFDSVNIELKTMKNVKINDFIGEAINFLNGLTEQLSEKDTDLLNIRDEILATVHQTLYLFTLQ